MTRTAVLTVALAIAATATIVIAAPQSAPTSNTSAKSIDGKRDVRGHGGGMLAADANKDGKVSRAEAAAQADARFTAMDANKDGFVDQTDFQARMQQHRNERFAALDANKDGRVTRAEFDASHSKRLAERVQQADKQGRQMRKGDPAQAAQRAEAMFTRLDANKDGAVTRAEFDAAKPMDGHGDGKHPGKRPAPQR